MCGNHHHDPVDPDGPARPVFRPRPRPATLHRAVTRSRRAFLGDVGRGALAMAVVTPLVVACGGSDDTADGTETDDGATDGGEDAASDTTGTPAAEPLRWARTNLGFVSAYVLARGNTAAIVDTGQSGSADQIGATLGELGLTYDDVDHVILTHHHGDHVGSITAVMERAAGATVYAGEADLDEIAAEAIVGLTGGEDVFGMEMLATPGHTAGHMAVIDHAAGLLVAGDAVFTEDGGVIEGPERFFDDIPMSRETIKALAELRFDTLLVGHGDPIEGMADTAVAALAASLP